MLLGKLVGVEVIVTKTHSLDLVENVEKDRNPEFGNLDIKKHKEKDLCVSGSRVRFHGATIKVATVDKCHEQDSDQQNASDDENNFFRLERVGEHDVGLELHLALQLDLLWLWLRITLHVMEIDKFESPIFDCLHDDEYCGAQQKDCIEHIVRSRRIQSKNQNIEKYRKGATRPVILVHPHALVSVHNKNDIFMISWPIEHTLRCKTA